MLRDNSSCEELMQAQHTSESKMWNRSCKDSKARLEQEQMNLLPRRETALWGKEYWRCLFYSREEGEGATPLV